MSYQLTLTASILRQTDGAIIPVDLLNGDYREYLAWCEAGNAPSAYAPPALTNDDFINATQKRLDALATSWNYDSMLSLVTYIDSLIPRFKAEATAGRDFRDATWADVVTIQTEVMGGTLVMPATIADYLSLLPAIPSRPVIA